MATLRCALQAFAPGKVRRKALAIHRRLWEEKAEWWAMDLIEADPALFETMLDKPGV